jgi:hypothetical protein
MVFSRKLCDNAYWSLKMVDTWDFPDSSNDKYRKRNKKINSVSIHINVKFDLNLKICILKHVPVESSLHYNYVMKT